MDDAELHSRAARIEKQIANFRILNPEGAVLGGFEKVKGGARDIGERISNIQKALKSFNLRGTDGVHVAGSLQSGYAINAATATTQSGVVTGPAIVFGCTDPAANNYNPAATLDDSSCTYDTPPCPELTFIREADTEDGTMVYHYCIAEPFGYVIQINEQIFNPDGDFLGGAGVSIACGETCSPDQFIDDPETNYGHIDVICVVSTPCP